MDALSVSDLDDDDDAGAGLLGFWFFADSLGGVVDGKIPGGVCSFRGVEALKCRTYN